MPKGRRGVRRQKLGLRLHIVRGPAVPLWRVLRELIDGVEDETWALPAVPRGAKTRWDIRLAWRNSELQDWREGPWKEVMEESAGRGDWEGLVLGYLRGELSKALRMARERATELEQAMHEADRRLREQPDFQALSDPVQAARRRELRNRFQEKINRIKPPEG